VREHIAKYSPRFVALVETKVKSSKVSTISSRALQFWQSLHNSDICTMEEYVFPGIHMYGIAIWCQRAHSRLQ